jgi:C4-dicarboxylate transporter DctQ subunit
VRIISKVFDLIEKAINSVIIVLLILMTLAIFYQVIQRYILHGANIWAEEFARYAFIWVVMLGSASALRRFNHIRIDFLAQLFSGRAQKIIGFCNNLLILAFLAVLMVYGLKIATRTAGQISAGVGVSMGFMYMSIPVGSALMFLFILEILARDYFSLGKGCDNGGGTV